MVSRIGAVSLALLGVITACTAIHNEGTTQCRSESDCLARGPSFADTTCSLDRVCVKIEASARACNTNRECIDRNGGAPFRCLPDEKRCVPLTSPECPTVWADQSDLLNDNTIYLGQMSPPNLDGQGIDTSMQTARSEIMENTGGGLPSARAGAAKRPLAIIHCAPEPAAAPVKGSLEEVLRGSRHLSQVVKTPIILGPLIPSSALSVANEVLVPDNMLMITSTPTPAIEGVADNDLAFTATSPEGVQLPLLNKLFADVLQPRALADGLVAPGEPLRVELLFVTDAVGLIPATNLQRDLVFNGKSTADNGPNFRPRSLGNAADRVSNPNPFSLTAAAIADVISFRPHVIVYATNPAASNQTLGPIEAQWPAGVPRPYHVSVISVWENFIVSAIGNRESLRQRYYGLVSTPIGINQEIFNSFASAVRLKFPEMNNANIGNLAAASYDSVYLAGLAIVAAGENPLTGVEIAKGLRRAGGDGQQLPIRETAYNQAIQAIQSGNTISALGASGIIRYNEKGARPGFPELFCVEGEGGVARRIVRPGYKLDPDTGIASGNSRCP